jgi:hypothetical protein
MPSWPILTITPPGRAWLSSLDRNLSIDLS